jgi:hypothetical protein
MSDDYMFGRTEPKETDSKFNLNHLPNTGFDKYQELQTDIVKHFENEEQTLEKLKQSELKISQISVKIFP